MTQFTKLFRIIRQIEYSNIESSQNNDNNISYEFHHDTMNISEFLQIFYPVKSNTCLLLISSKQTTRFDCLQTLGKIGIISWLIEK